MPTRDLMLRFESLGQNCEFGLVQRRCGSEPLGLLRFASTPLPHLLAAFEGGFEGLGGPDAIEIIPSPNEGRDCCRQETQPADADPVYRRSYHQHPMPRVSVPSLYFSTSKLRAALLPAGGILRAGILRTAKLRPSLRTRPTAQRRAWRYFAASNELIARHLPAESDFPGNGRARPDARLRPEPSISRHVGQIHS